MASQRSLFRSLLRRCRHADRRPMELAATIRRPPRQFDMAAGQNASLWKRRWMFIDDAMTKAGGGCTEFMQPSAGTTRALPLAARQHYQMAQMLGLDYAAEVQEFQQRLDTGHKLVRTLATVSAEVAVSKTPSESPAIRDADFAMPSLQRLAPGETAAGPFAVGDMLITHPLSCMLQPIFDQAVIVIDGVTDTVTTEVRGLVLNTPAGMTLRELLMKGSRDEDYVWAKRLGPLLDLQLYMGGPVTGNSLKEGLSWLHTHGDKVYGSREVLPGLWAGGDAVQLSTLALEHPGDVRLCLGYAGWAGPQLTTELERGVWVHARRKAVDMYDMGEGKQDAFERLYALQRWQRRYGADARLDQTGEGGLARFCLSSVEPSAVWRAALRGADMPVLADFPRGGSVDEHLVKFVEEHYHQAAKELS